jgi:succinate dehydrogenase / fumarate reductase flavoprotein subunit
METTIQNFYVAGECTMGVHGGNRLGGNSLMETMVFGKRVAEKILSTDIPRSPQVDTDDQLGHYQIQEEGVDPLATLTNIRESMWHLAGIIRNEHELLDLQEQLATIQQQISQQGIKPLRNQTETIISTMRVHTVIELAQLITL